MKKAILFLSMLLSLISISVCAMQGNPQPNPEQTRQLLTTCKTFLRNVDQNFDQILTNDEINANTVDAAATLFGIFQEAQTRVNQTLQAELFYEYGNIERHFQRTLGYLHNPQEYVDMQERRAEIATILFQ